MEATFEDKVVLITGSGKGIGQTTALEFAKNGAHVIVNDVNQDLAQKTARKIEDLGAKVTVNHYDVSSNADCKKMVSEIRTSFKALDVLINNAGILRDSTLLKLKEEDWDAVIAVNLKGPFNVAQAAAEVFKEQKFGRIINISSIARVGNVGQTNYAAAKAGVVGMTSTWALELARYNVTVNAIAPGLVKTEMTDSIPAEIKERLINAVPLRRMAETTEIASAILFLASDAAKYITGQCLHVDGGATTGLKLG